MTNVVYELYSPVDSETVGLYKTLEGAQSWKPYNDSASEVYRKISLNWYQVSENEWYGRVPGNHNCPADYVIYTVELKD